MSLQTRLEALVAAIGADHKAQQAMLDVDFNGYTPPSGAWAQPQNILGMGAGTPGSGQVSYYPIDVGPTGLTLQSIGCNVTTARVGGTVVEKIGLYKDNGTGGAPLVTAAGLLVSGAVTLTSTGNKTVATSLALTKGRYWSAFFYLATVAPGTAPQLTCCNNATTLWSPNTFFGTVCRYLRTTGLTDLPVAGQAPTIGSDALGPVVGLRAA